MLFNEKLMHVGRRPITIAHLEPLAQVSLRIYIYTILFAIVALLHIISIEGNFRACQWLNLVKISWTTRIPPVHY